MSNKRREAKVWVKTNGGTTGDGGGRKNRYPQENKWTKGKKGSVSEKK